MINEPRGKFKKRKIQALYRLGFFLFIKFTHILHNFLKGQKGASI